MTNAFRINLKKPADVAAVVPYLLGFHPHDQLAILALHSGRILFAAATPVPFSADAADDAASIAIRIAAHDPDRVILIGYGPDEPIATAVNHTQEAFNALGVAVLATLRVHDSRIWHLGCDAPVCQTDGVPFDSSTTAVAAHATFLGLAPADNIDTFAARLAPITGPDREAMRKALIAAHQHLADIATGTEEEIEARFQGLAEDLIDETLTTYQQDHHFPDDRAALLLALLTDPQTSDVAIPTVEGDELDVRIWTDLTRRADDPHVAAPATLLALAAMQNGNGLLARLAIERAQEVDPDDPLIQAMAHAIARGVDPTDIRRRLRE
ncbi:hypothetical protein FB565_000215 [Actinoplanes lutulentus]|uniref:Uncharacterized protein DUF4192 n=1 Tax=Actinoplanes lutulentus TaxID=1287878 RepID=A0A327Z4Z3_9ACTN|nr:DUF4192 domain-containing protein [Actinoplanes lutulentus]MBB2940511.1 hypothetical protein [Actinoplanes lutulentus]RAK25493.1 uncharacterized protein DUF4192 [Actinoplanes lutulentus]